MVDYIINVYPPDDEPLVCLFKKGIHYKLIHQMVYEKSKIRSLDNETDLTSSYASDCNHDIRHPCSPVGKRLDGLRVHRCLVDFYRAGMAASVN